MTNRQKFTEVFDCEIVRRDTGEPVPGHCKILIAESEHFDEWLQKEYEPSAQQGWIPVTERLPENEQEVFVTVEVRLSGRKPFRRVVRAFYTDGRHTDADSAYSWDEFPDPQYDDDDNMIIPEGWWESSDYLEQQGMIDDFVMAWREPLKPWEGGTG